MRTCARRQLASSSRISFTYPRARFYSQQPDVSQKLKQWRESAITNSQARLAAWTDSAGQQLALLGSKLNHLTGYELVEELKRQVVEQESRIDIARDASRQAKTAYEDAVAERSQCQREVNDLLQRKSSWSDSDVLRFTNLVRQDHLNEQAEAKAKVEASEADAAIEQEFQKLTKAILNRYHEEQVWSDKIRSASTYGSLVALGLNLVVFVMAIIVVEPYKRKKMAQTFEKRIETLSAETKEMVERIASRVDDHLVKQEALLAPLVASQEINTDAPLPMNDSIAQGYSLPVDKREIMAAGFGAATAMVFCGALLLTLTR